MGTEKLKVINQEGQAGAGLKMQGSGATEADTEDKALIDEIEVKAKRTPIWQRLFSKSSASFPSPQQQ